LVRLIKVIWWTLKSQTWKSKTWKMEANHSVGRLVADNSCPIAGGWVFWSQEDKGSGGSRLMPDLNEIKASLSLKILRVADLLQGKCSWNMRGRKNKVSRVYAPVEHKRRIFITIQLLQHVKTSLILVTLALFEQ
jgi:hypothetical protein